MNNSLSKSFDALEQRKTDFWTIIEQASPEQRVYKPQPDAWCMLQVAQHILASERGTLGFMQKRPPVKLSFGQRLRSSFKASLLSIALRLPIKFKAPNVPGLSPESVMPYEDIQQQWDEVRQNWRIFLENYPTDKLDYIVFKHPAGAKMTLSQTLDNFLYRHLEHHLQQLKRLQKVSNTH